MPWGLKAQLETWLRQLKEGAYLRIPGYHLPWQISHRDKRLSWLVTPYDHLESDQGRMTVCSSLSTYWVHQIDGPSHLN